MQPLVITAAVVGAEVTKRDQPNLPVTPTEIADAAIECWRAGASICHIHVRNDDGTPSQDSSLYQQVIQRVNSQCDMIVQVSTGGSVGMSADERLSPLVLAPEMASLTLGTVNFGNEVFYNPLPMIIQFAQEMQKYGVKPELEIFDTGMIQNAYRLLKLGLIHKPLHFDFVMGVPGGINATAKDLLHLVESIPADATWSVAGIGRHQLPLATLAIVLGGHVRVGFEDNIFYKKGVLADSNAQLVERIVRIAAELGRPVATPTEARDLFGLSTGQTKT